MTSAGGRRLDFDPAVDGFGFPNAFCWEEDDLAHLAAELRGPVTFLGAFLVGVGGRLAGGRRGGVAGAAAGAVLGSAVGAGIVRGVARRWRSFGLCGGMALAAVERWPHRAGLRTGELNASRIRALLRRRQSATLHAAGLRFLGYWATTRALRGVPAGTPLGGALRREVEYARRRIDAGRPVVLGLVGDLPDPFQMHQVAAFGYRHDGTATRFDVYDPNAPGVTRHVTAHVCGARCGVTTDPPLGLAPGEGVPASTEPGRLAMAFVVA